MNATQAPQAQEIHTRFLYPFLFDLGKDKAGELASTLQGLQIETRKGKAAVWQSCDALMKQASEDRERQKEKENRRAKARNEGDSSPARSPLHSLLSRYSDELTPTVREFLFPQSGAAGCHYLRIEGQAQRWFRNHVTVEHGDKLCCTARLDAPRIELFLSHYGAGVLSIALHTQAENRPGDEGGIALAELKRFDYRLAQIRRPRTVPTLGIPHPQNKLDADRQKDADQSSEKPHSTHANAPPPPATDAKLEERLGAAGGRFTLSELVDFLLGPAQGKLGFAPTQEQFSVYSVVRFGSEVDLTDPATQSQLGPLLAGLAQVEEPDHAGAVPGAPLDVPNHLMNSCQWAAVGVLGAAHLVADQYQPPRGFDQQRVTQYRDKYFIAYLVARLQRLTLQRGADDAARAVAGDVQQRRDAFRTLHGDLLDFSVAGHYTEISSRHAVNRFYHLAQQGLGVDTALATVTNAVRSHEARQISEDVATNVRTVSHVQRKVEWLEIFFVSFYATELAHLLSDHSFSHVYSTWSVLAAPFLGGGLAAWGLKPWTRRHVSGKERWGFTALALLTLVVAWLEVGYLYFPLQSGH